MAISRTIDTRHLGENRYRDLQVYYDKGGMSYWDYSKKPKGIYFASHLYSRSGGTVSWSTQQQGDGYLLVVPLVNYSAKALRLVQERVKTNAARIHDILDGTSGTFVELKALLEGQAIDATSPVQESA
jgi:hypothetical protein